MINTYNLYFHLNPKTFQIFYVGIGNKYRAYNFTERSEFWKRYVNKYGEPIVKIIHQNLTKEEACTLEKSYIKEYGRKLYDSGGILVNMSEGGEGGNRGIIWTKEQNEKRANSNRGKKRSEETKLKQRLAKLGTKQSPETIEKRRLKKIGVKQPNISKARLGLKQPKSFSLKKYKKIYQMDLNENIIKQFDSIQFAANSLGFKNDPGGISRVLHGTCKTAYGFKWKFIN